MSECVFAFFQLATVLLLERNADGPNERRSVWLAAFGGGTAAFAVLVRSAGIGLLVAGALFLLKEHRFRHALVFGAVSVAMLLPWATYARVHAPTAEERYTHGGSIVYSYGEQVWMRWAGDPASGSATLRDMPARVATNIVDVFGRDMIGIFAPTLLRGASESGEEIVSLGGAAGLTQGSMGNAPATMAISLLFSAMVLTGFAQAIRSRVTIAEILVPIALAIIVLWPFWTFRFVVPLASFLFLYFVRGVQTIAAWARHALDHDHEGGFDLARVVLLAIVGLSVLDHAAYLYMVRQAGSTSVSWLQQARETDAALEWMRGNLEPGVVATTNPGLVFLRTGQRTISFDRIHSGWQGWRDRGVRYIACLLVVELPPDAAREVKVLYKSAGGFWIVEI
jgi:hypothetical protein